MASFYFDQGATKIGDERRMSGITLFDRVAGYSCKTDVDSMELPNLVYLFLLTRKSHQDKSFTVTYQFLAIIGQLGNSLDPW